MTTLLRSGQVAQTAVDAGCDDITLCATTDCCPIPFAELTTDERNGNA